MAAWTYLQDATWLRPVFVEVSNGGIHCAAVKLYPLSKEHTIMYPGTRTGTLMLALAPLYVVAKQTRKIVDVQIRPKYDHW